MVILDQFWDFLGHSRGTSGILIVGIVNSVRESLNLSAVFLTLDDSFIVKHIKSGCTNGNSVSENEMFLTLCARRVGQRSSVLIETFVETSLQSSHNTKFI